MIIFVATEDHRYTLKSISAAASDIEIRIASYRELFAAKQIPRATYVFTDLDRLAPEQLHRAGQIYRGLRDRGVRVLNDPARIPSRFGLLRHLALLGRNDFNAYRVEEGTIPVRWPVFLRVEGGHDATVSDLLPDWPSAQRAIAAAIAAGYPLPALLLVEYAAEPVLPGLYRKLSLYRIGASVFAATCVHDTQWLVKHGKTGIAPPELYADELRIIRDNPYRDSVGAIFELAGIEYGRADFGLVGGRVQLYEINSNPNIELVEEHPSADRHESLRRLNANIFAGLSAIDTPA